MSQEIKQLTHKSLPLSIKSIKVPSHRWLQFSTEEQLSDALKVWIYVGNDATSRFTNAVIEHSSDDVHLTDH